MGISLADVERNLSLPRLAPYRLHASDDAEALCLYLWNMELSQALQPAMHAIEVTLRNSIHAAGVAQFGADDWFRDPNTLTLHNREQRMLDQAVEQLWHADRHDVRRIKLGLDPAPPLPTVGKHIAALTLGFWVNLFNTPYKRQLWSAIPPRRNLLPLVFPHATKAQRQQRLLHQKLVRIRDFRNRVSHHEPIWNWPATVDRQYREIMEVVGSISPATTVLVGLIDQFPALHRRGHRHYLTVLSLRQ